MIEKDNELLGENASMMKFFKYLYWSNDIRKKDQNRIKWYLKVNKKHLFVYTVTLCDGQDQLEIYYSPVLQQHYYRQNPPFVIGLAKTYDGAVGIVCQIANECYAKYGHCDLKYYLSSL